MNNDGWIPVEDRLPEEKESIFAKFKGTDKWKQTMFEKESANVLVTAVFRDGTKLTIIGYTLDGKWKTRHDALHPKVIAWRPFPEPWKGYQ